MCPMFPSSGRPQPAAGITLAWHPARPGRRFRLPTRRRPGSRARPGRPDAADRSARRCLLDDGGARSRSEERKTPSSRRWSAWRRGSNSSSISPVRNASQAFSTPFDTIRSFLPRCGREQPFRSREVHHLAFHYHWSEADILGLDRARRRDYLSLLSESCEEMRGDDDGELSRAVAAAGAGPFPRPASYAVPPILGGQATPAEHSTSEFPALENAMNDDAPAGMPPAAGPHLGPPAHWRGPRARRRSLLRPQLRRPSR